MADVKEADIPTLLTLKDCFDYLKFAENLRKAFLTMMAIVADAPTRDIGVLDYSDFKAVTVAIKIATSDTAERDMTLVERGKLKSLHELAAVVCGKQDSFEEKARVRAAAAKAAASAPPAAPPAKT